MSCAALLDGNAQPKSMSRARQWTDIVENLYRFQEAGYRDELEYMQIKQVEGCGGCRVYPGNTVCEAGIHPEWYASTPQTFTPSGNLASLIHQRGNRRTQRKPRKIDRWPETGFVKKLQRRDNTFYYYSRKRECEDRDVYKVKVYVY